MAEFDAGCRLQSMTHKVKYIKDGYEGKRGTKISYLLDYDDSLLCGLVSDDVEHVVTADDAVLHLGVAADIWIISLNTSYGASDLCRLHSSHTE